ncbi:hypothetical protein [Parerythrobacter lacustris]|uniref:Uncharacterized protein n=1 Tax=Parerythrobacter lacustris TaxID=2969984 RepID=A0ABT1XRM2_9SPHN|nr:hypothetical protein [Parerythrobacter lacustris]MCR2834304.1 hypothetical protein [Parerythrobacter lacustris]
MTYADLADLSDGAQLVLRANVRKQAVLEPERAAGVAPGHVRLYVEARTTALISGSVPVGEALRYLVDVPLDSRGKIPKLKNREVLLFAKPVAGRPGEIQLVASDAQLLWSDSVEARVRDILRESVAADAPPRLRGVRDVLSVAGTLTGESETQLFIDTAGDGPLSITVARRPGQPAVWGVSWSEIVDQAARPPERETLEWYRLACFLPAQLPVGSSLSADPADRRRAEQDYRFVLEQLGPCPRNRS